MSEPLAYLHSDSFPIVLYECGHLSIRLPMHHLLDRELFLGALVHVFEEYEEDVQLLADARRFPGLEDDAVEIDHRNDGSLFGCEASGALAKRDYFQLDLRPWEV